MALLARRGRKHEVQKQKIFIPALRLRGRKRKMKKNILKKIVAFAAAAALIVCTLLFAGCQNEGKIRISIAQIADHPSLDTIRDSIVKTLAENGYKDGENCVIVTKSAQGDASNLNTIMDNFAANKSDVVIAIATPTAMQALNIADKVPVLFSAVSSPVEAGLTSSLEHPDKNVTGTCDAVPVDRIIDLAVQLYPEIKTMGFIYNVAEASSEANVRAAKKYCQEKGIACTEATVANSSEVQQAARALVTKCDAIFTPTDNTVATGMTSLSEIAAEAKIPVFAGADSMVKDGALATIGINYEDLGRETALMAVKVLAGTKVSDIPVKVFDDLDTYINTKTAAQIGFEFSPEFLAGERVIDLA